jgi:hypothetical protein
MKSVPQRGSVWLGNETPSQNNKEWLQGQLVALFCSNCSPEITRVLLNNLESGGAVKMCGSFQFTYSPQTDRLKSTLATKVQRLFE